MPDDTTQPLDYFNPLAKPRPAEPLVPAAPAAKPAVVVPLEFDRLLSRSSDHGAIAAVEAALRVNKISVFRADDGELAGRELTLYVRGDDYARAAPLAAGIFVRRQRIKAFPRQEIPKDEPPRFGGFGPFGL